MHRAGIQIGTRDRAIVMQTATETQDPNTGEVLIDWTVGARTVFAEWLPGSTREAWFAQRRLEAHVDGVFRVPWMARPDPARTRILFQGLVYDVRPPVEIGRGIGWEIPVTAKLEG